MSDSQDYVTDYKRVEKAGSAHHGAGVWLRERISGLLLAPLTVWGVWEIGRGDGFGYDALVRWMRVSIVNPILLDRKSTRLNSSHIPLSRMPSSA